MDALRESVASMTKAPLGAGEAKPRRKMAASKGPAQAMKKRLS
jgi:hypothetical protein